MKGNQIIKIMLATVAASVVTTTSALAAIPVPYGWYGEINIGSSKTNNTNYPGKVSSGGTAYNLSAGYKFLPFFAAEAGYTKYANARSKNTLGTTAAKATQYSVDLAGKGILPINDSGFELFCKLGVARIMTNLTETNPAAAAVNGLSYNTGHHNATGAYFGVGADFAFTSNLQLNGQWERANGNSTTGNLDLYSVGITFTAA